MRDPEIGDPEAYVESLAQYIADRRVMFEVCRTSNLQTMPHLKSVKQHPLRTFRENRINTTICTTTICTDNRTVSDTTVTRDWSLAVEALGLSRSDMKSMIIYGFKRSFFPGNYLR